MFPSAPHSRTTSTHENCALLGCYAASSGNSLPTFRGNLSVPPSGAEITATRRLTTQKSAALIHLAAEAWNHAPLVYVSPLIWDQFSHAYKTKKLQLCPSWCLFCFTANPPTGCFGMCRQSAVVVRTAVGLDWRKAVNWITGFAWNICIQRQRPWPWHG